MPEPEFELFVGVDVGGTNVKIGFVSEQGQVLQQTSLPTCQERGPADAMDRAAEAIRDLIEAHGLAKEQILAVGLGTPGTMDIPSGMILEPPNLPAWRHFAVRDYLSEAVGKPVAYANDANAAAFGEFWIGAGQNYDSMVMLTLGTGVGGGIVVFGKTIDGQHSLGGEIGHTIVDTAPAARLCSCGQRGHLEAYASATAVVQRMAEAIAAGNHSSLQELAQSGKLTSLEMCRHAERGDPWAKTVIRETAGYLAIGILNAIHMIDPEAVVLGGAMNFGGMDSPVGTEFLAAIRNEVDRLALSLLRGSVKIDFASLGGDAGFIGAAGIARKMIRERQAIY